MGLEVSSPEDIPEGRILNFGKGSLNALRDALSEMRQKLITGYLKVVLAKGNKSSNGYLFFKNGMLIAALYLSTDLVTTKTELHFGEECLTFIREDSNDETSVLEHHSEIDMDKILRVYPNSRIGKITKIPEKPSKPVLRPLKKDIIESKEVTIKPKKSISKSRLKVGLVWGPEEEEDKERALLKEKLERWKARNYIVSKLEKLLEKDFENAKEAFRAYEEIITKLEQFKIELNSLVMKGLKTDVNALRAKLNDPEKIMEIELEIRSLRELATKRARPPPTGREFKILEEEKAKISEELRKEQVRPELAEKKPIEKLEMKERIPIAQIRVGSSYLIKEDRPIQSVKLFIGTTAQGFKGLFITRVNPKKVRTDFDLKTAELLWLTDTETTEPSVPPSLERLMHRIEEFLNKNEKVTLFLDGLEYLISSNNFDAVLRFLRRLIDIISEANAVFLLSVSPQTLKEQELKIIEREMEVLTGKPNN